MHTQMMPLSRSGSQVKSGKGCWTCKRRKIGCDQGVPSCENCIRTKRKCEGYGIKLHWPEAGDGRRPLHKWESNRVESLDLNGSWRSNSYHFLNTTYGDLDPGLSRESSLILASRRAAHIRGVSTPPLSPPRSLGFGFEVNLTPKDLSLLSYYTQVLSRMITTIDDGRNGFRTVLLPNALSEHTLSSKSLRYSILALSAAHLWGGESATGYKLSAIRLLSESIRRGEDGSIGQFAACMMLCVCDVFDSADGSWYTHLCAARGLLSQIQRFTTHGQPLHFLESWMAYHSVLAEFSYGIQEEAISSVSQIPSQASENTIIVGSLGCSMQVLECISCVNRLTHIIQRRKGEAVPQDIAHLSQSVQSQLESLQQIPSITEDSTSGQIDEARILNTAELYKLGALIYLHRSVFNTPTGSDIMRDLVARSIEILRKLEVCTSPWPLFMTACEVVGDEQRIKILDTLDKMQTKRRIANVEIMRGLIEAFWKRCDLVSNEKVRVDWKELIQDGQHMPNFI